LGEYAVRLSRNPREERKPVISCDHCQHVLDVQDVVPPRLGLAQIVCAHCGRKHLFSPHEIEVAQGRTTFFRYHPIPEHSGVLYQVRRFLVG
jgi:transcription elongation factor Elf1